jgi:hypothetical protein
MRKKKWQMIGMKWLFEIFIISKKSRTMMNNYRMVQEWHANTTKQYDVTRVKAMQLLELNIPPKTFVFPKVWILLWNQYSVGFSSKPNNFLGMGFRGGINVLRERLSDNGRAPNTWSEMAFGNRISSEIQMFDFLVVGSGGGSFTFSPVFFSMIDLKRPSGSGGAWKAKYEDGSNNKTSAVKARPNNGDFLFLIVAAGDLLEFSCSF